MTTPNGNILFNNVTGSDTQASGLGPATAVFGTTGSCTSASAIVTGIDTTGVSAGDLFWGQTSSGRQFSIIASVDSGSQVTLDDTLSATHSGDLTWAIGGKRANLISNADNITLFGSSGAKGGWTIDVEYTGTDYSVSDSVINFGAAGDTTNGPIKLLSTSINKPRIKCTNFSFGGNFLYFNTANYWHFENLEFERGGSVSGSLFLFDSSYITFKNCVFVGTKVGGCISINDFVNNFCVEDCYFSGADYSSAITKTGGSSPGLIKINRNFIKDCTSNAISITSQYLIIIDNIISTVGGDGIRLTTALSATIKNNTIYNCTGDGVELLDAASLMQFYFENNILSNNGGYGINIVAGVGFSNSITNNNNNYYNNTSGDRNNLAVGAGDLAVDPQFVNVAGDNFGIGTNLKAKGSPISPRTIGANQSGTTTYVDIGAAQRPEPEKIIHLVGVKL